MHLIHLSVVALGAVIGAKDAIGQTVFFDDFGSGTGRRSSPYVPSKGADSSLGPDAFYKYAASGKIPIYTYALMRPSQLTMANTQQDFWKPLSTDHSGSTNGAVAVFNVGDRLNQLYRRAFPVEAGKSYKVSVWRYLVNASKATSPQGPVHWGFELQNVNSEHKLATSPKIASKGLLNWEQSSWVFTIPDNCVAPDGGVLQSVIALRNLTAERDGNDIYIDDFSVTVSGTPGTIVECPTEREFAVDARDDSATTLRDTQVLIPVTANDSTILGLGSPGNEIHLPSLAQVAAPARGSITIDRTTGVIAYTPKPGLTGRDTFSYQVCNDAPNPVCDTAIVTVDVSAGVVVANDDFVTVKTSATAQTVKNVLQGDMLGSSAATAQNTRMTVVSNPNNSPELTLNTSTGALVLAAGTPPGVYSVEYELCEAAVPTNCDRAVATTYVSAGDLVVPAPPLQRTTASPQDTPAGSVLNDVTLGGNPINPGDVTVTATNKPNNSPALTVDPTTGVVTVAGGTPPGSYTMEYQVCEINAPTNCKTQTVTVKVGVGDLVLVDPVITTPVGDQDTTVGNVLIDGTLGPNPVTPGDVTITPTNNPNNSPALTVDPTTGDVIVAGGTPPGEHTLEYEVCEINDPSNCETKTVTVHVSAGDLALPAPVMTTTASPQDTPAGSVLDG
ncbi:hypothetical protein E8K88_03940, partial [Lampropedia aestuarii]